MKITVGIPCHRYTESLRRLINGLDRQKTGLSDLKREVEVIIVNDGGDHIISNADFDVKNINIKVINQENEGVSSARNRVISSALGNLIFFLDDDCYPTENWMQAMYMRFKIDEHIDGIGGRIIPFPKKGLVNEYYNITNRLEKPMVDYKTGEIVTIITANCGFCTSALRSVGGFDQKIFAKNVGGEDVDLTYRLRQKGYHLSYEPNAVVFHEYPEKFSTIFNKYSNYGTGMRIYCKARNINPQSIRQPQSNLISCVIYLLRFPGVFRKSYFIFNKKVGRFKSVLFAFFDFVRYIAHWYGFLIKKN